MNKRLDVAIKWLMALGFITLPYTHVKWIPDLGTTRPVSLFFFAAVFGLVMLRGVVANRGNPKGILQWMRGWDNWPMLRWWVGLIGLGVLSAIATFFYGIPVQALLRLLGYFAIFVTLFIVAYSLPRFGIRAIARFILIGYLPVLVYAVIEALALQGNIWASIVVNQVRTNFIVPFGYGGRLTLLATEPSFVAFQLILLVLLIPYISERWLRWCGWALIVICLVYSKSTTVLVLTITYLALWGIFSLRRPILAWLTGAVTAVFGTGLLADKLFPATRILRSSLINALYSYSPGWLVSGTIRFSYFLNLINAIVDTHGIGLGIGQYGRFWKDIFLRHHLQLLDNTGEVAAALASNTYMKPWSVILGIGVDLGLLGLALFAIFLWQIFRALKTPRHHALFFTCLVAMAGAYPIVTPHVWLVLALMAGLGSVPSKENWDVSEAIAGIERIPKRYHKRITIFSILISIVLFSTSIIVALNRQGLIVASWQTQTLEGIQLYNAYAYRAATYHPELSAASEHPSIVQVLEDGKPLYGLDNLNNVMLIGLGRYTFRDNYVYFSSSDTSNPTTNGRRYEIVYPVIVGHSTADWLYKITALVILLTIMWSVIKNRGLLEKEKSTP